MQPEAMVPVGCWRLPHCQAYWGAASLVADLARFPMIVLGQVERLIHNIRQKSAPIPLQQSQRNRSDPIPRQPTGIAVSLHKLLDPNLLVSCRVVHPPSRTLPRSRSLGRSHVAMEAIPRKTPGRVTRLPNYREQMNRPLLFATGQTKWPLISGSVFCQYPVPSPIPPQHGASFAVPAGVSAKTLVYAGPFGPSQPQDAHEFMI